MIRVPKYKRNNDGIGQDGRQAAEPAVLTQHIAADSADECGQGPENNIRQGASCQNITEQASDGQTGNRRRRKKGQNCQRFREADLNRAAGQVESGCQGSQNNIDSSNNARMGNINDSVMIH